MTREEIQLLLKDLSARLMYGVMCQVDDGAAGLNDGKLVEIDISKELVRFEVDYYWDAYIDDVKPYLRPISSMTEEEMDRLFDILHIDKDGKDEDWIKINDVYGIKFFFPTGKWIENVAEAYDYLYSIHIDFRGLIHKGLAIEVTEDNNPYKE